MPMPTSTVADVMRALAGHAAQAVSLRCAGDVHTELMATYPGLVSVLQAVAGEPGSYETALIETQPSWAPGRWEVIGRRSRAILAGGQLTAGGAS